MFAVGFVVSVIVIIVVPTSSFLLLLLSLLLVVVVYVVIVVVLVVVGVFLSLLSCLYHLTLYSVYRPMSLTQGCELNT